MGDVSYLGGWTLRSFMSVDHLLLQRATFRSGKPGMCAWCNHSQELSYLNSSVLKDFVLCLYACSVCHRITSHQPARSVWSMVTGLTYTNTASASLHIHPHIHAYTHTYTVVESTSLLSFQTYLRDDLLVDSFCADLVEPFSLSVHLHVFLLQYLHGEMTSQIWHVQVTFIGELKQEKHAVEVKKPYILFWKNNHSTVKLLCKNGRNAPRIRQYCSVEMGQTSRQCTMYSKENIKWPTQHWG